VSILWLGLEDQAGGLRWHLLLVSDLLDEGGAAQMKLGRAVFLLASRLSVWSLLLAGGACLADVPTSLQECRLRNSAICELRGLQYVVEGPCPPPAQTPSSQLSSFA